MSIKTRLIILGLCVLAFLLVTPYIVLYSLGYRVDFETLQIRGTGGIYVYAQPDPSSVMIDAVSAPKSSYFSSAVFVQNLMPGPHSVLIKKDGYYDYQKSLLVKEREVAKLENVTLFKQKINFALLENGVDYAAISPDESALLLATTQKAGINFDIITPGDNQKKSVILPVLNGKITEAAWSGDANKIVVTVSGNYYLLDASLAQPVIAPLLALVGASQVTFNPQNSQELFFVKNGALYSSLKTTPIIKNVIAYHAENSSVTFLAADGFLYQSDMAGITKTSITAAAFPLNPGATYEITMAEGMTFLQENNMLFLLDKATKSFQPLSTNISGLAHSPNNQKIAYFGDHQIFISSAARNYMDVALLDTYSDAITQVQWLNNDYVVVVAGNTVTLSEIDNRGLPAQAGNINKVALPSTLPLLQGENIAMQNPVIFFRQQDKKLYIFTQKEVIVSERLVP